SCLDARNEPKKIKLPLRHGLRCELRKRKIEIDFIDGDDKFYHSAIMVYNVYDFQHFEVLYPLILAKNVLYGYFYFY
ncbi:MAG: hypothetical protein NC320_09400, partial [Clostridium sp.]|nr:hypothetical protein [Clostridium sp.]